MQAKDVMTTKVVTVKKDTTVEDIVDLLLTHRISGVPVVNEQNHVIGVVTEGDLLFKKRLPTSIDWVQMYGPYLRPEELVKEHRKTKGLKAEDIMTPKPICVNENTPVVEIAKLMLQKGIKRVFVLRNDTLVGVVSRGDILKDLVKTQKEEKQK